MFLTPGIFSMTISHIYVPVYREVTDISCFVSGMLHAGLGHRNMVSFLSTVEVRGLHHSSLKSQERHIGPHLQTLAEQSCERALREEAASVNVR